jgi:hypothetical protein
MPPRSTSLWAPAVSSSGKRAATDRMRPGVAVHAAMHSTARRRGLVTVFGGTGFLGRRIVRHLLDHGFPVRTASRHPERLGSASRPDAAPETTKPISTTRLRSLRLSLAPTVPSMPSAYMSNAAAKPSMPCMSRRERCETTDRCFRHWLRSDFVGAVHRRARQSLSIPRTTCKSTVTRAASARSTIAPFRWLN